MMRMTMELNEFV